MPPKKAKKAKIDKLQLVSDELGRLRTALGRSVVALAFTQEALRKDRATLRVNAIQLGGEIRGVQSRQRLIFTELRKLGVLPKGKIKKPK